MSAYNGGGLPPIPRFNRLALKIRGLRGCRRFRIGARGNAPAGSGNKGAHSHRPAAEKPIAAGAVHKRVIDLRSVVPAATAFVCIVRAADHGGQFPVVGQYGLFDILHACPAHRKPRVDISRARFVVRLILLYIMLAADVKPAVDSLPCAHLLFAM
mgnify:CR=1 FL=1